MMGWNVIWYEVINEKGLSEGLVTETDEGMSHMKSVVGRGNGESRKCSFRQQLKNRMTACLKQSLCEETGWFKVGQ